MLKIIAFIDGASRGNPGPAGAGIHLIDAADGRELLRLAIPLGHTTNNIAEYRALINALKKAVELKAAQIEVRSDSQLLIRQMRGEYRVKNHAIAKLVIEAMNLLTKFESYEFVHIPREHNKVADHLASLAAVAAKGEQHEKPDVDSLI